MTEDNKPRQYPRCECLTPVPVTWKYGSQSHIGKAENVSLGGLFIETATPPVLGSLVLLLFYTPDGEVRMRAMVRSVKPGQGMGLELTSMDQESRARFSHWLEQLSKPLEEPAASI